MRKIAIILLVAVFSLLLSAQTVKIVPATDDQGAPIVNALIKHVVADTNSSGEQLHDIYKLERGKTYFYNQSPIFKNPITLVADEPGETNETKPPKVLIQTDDEGDTPYAHCLTTFADLTVRNIAFSTTTIEESYSWANIVLVEKDGLNITLENCIFELSGWGMIEAVKNNNKIVVDRCTIRNGVVIGGGQTWSPFFLELDSGTVDSLIMTNNTFFNLQASIINVETTNPINYFKFDHNTCVNIGKGFSTAIHSHINSTITNNIFYNTFSHSTTLAEIEGSEDGVINGIMTVDTLIFNDSQASDSLKALSPIDEVDRKFTLKNNVYYFSDNVVDYFESYDSVLTVPWMDDRTQSMFDDESGYPYLIAENNVSQDPGFANFGGTDAMVEAFHSHRSGGTIGFWGWDPDSVDYPEVHWAFLQWPLPEDFSYSASLSSTDGYHVGSLQWYKDELEQYIITGVEGENETSSIPEEYKLGDNYPNPFNPATTITYAIPAAGKVNLSVYNVLGQKVAELVNGFNAAGTHKINFNASNLASGVYIYRIEAGKFTETKKMMLLK